MNGYNQSMVWLICVCACYVPASTVVSVTHHTSEEQTAIARSILCKFHFIQLKEGWNNYRLNNF